MVWEHINGLMDVNMKDSGKITNFMEKEYILGQMEESMMETILMTRKADLGHISGLMVEFMRAIGKMENNMDQEN